MTLINNWIHTHLERILGTISGLSVVVFDIPDLILKLVLAFVLGFLGAAGGWAWKQLIDKLKNKTK
jgi:hypothetical protein